MCGGRGIWEFLALFAQCCGEPSTALKKLNCNYKIKKKNHPLFSKHTFPRVKKPALSARNQN